MSTTVKLQHLHTDELRASFDVGIKGRGLAQSCMMWTNVTQKRPQKLKLATLGDVDPFFCVHKSPILNNRPAP